jgi:SulP family sulfate permease
MASYRKAWLSKDLTAGLTVGIVLIPQGMAYALLAGLPPIYGLYGGLVPLILYAVFGTSRQLSVGPVAISGLLVLAGISQLAEPQSPRYIELAILTGLLTGIVQLAMGAFRLGILVNFLSQPVISGFSSAAAVIIGISQLEHVFRLTVPYELNTFEKVGYLARHTADFHWPTAALALGALVLLISLKHWKERLPGALLVTVLGLGLVYGFGLDQAGIAIVGDVPAGLPGFQLPQWSGTAVQEVLPTVFTLSVIGVVECMSIALALESQNRTHTVQPNQELIAIGLSKIGGAFFRSLPTSASFTRSAINNAAGGRTGLASLTTAGLVALTLIWLTPLFHYLPTAVLAAIVLRAVYGLFEWRRAVALSRVHRTDFAMLLATFGLTLGLGIEEGVLAGVLLSVITIMLRAARPHVALLGKLPGGDHYRSLDRFPEAEAIPEVAILRFDADLYFINARYLTDTVLALIQGERKPNLIILEAAAISHIDSSGLEALDNLLGYLEDAGVAFYVAGAVGPVRDRLAKAGLMERIGTENQYLSIGKAVHAWQQGRSTTWSAAAVQTNKGR